MPFAVPGSRIVFRPEAQLGGSAISLLGLAAPQGARWDGYRVSTGPVCSLTDTNLDGQERPCRLAGLCGMSVSHRAVPKSASATPSFAQVQKNPMLAMQNVMKMCKSG